MNAEGAKTMKTLLVVALAGLLSACASSGRMGLPAAALGQGPVLGENLTPYVTGYAALYRDDGTCEVWIQAFGEISMTVEGPREFCERTRARSRLQQPAQVVEPSPGQGQ